MTDSTAPASAPGQAWQRRQHDKRPRHHGMKGRELKWGQRTGKRSYRIDGRLLLAARKIADRRETTLSTILVEAVEVGGAGWQIADARTHLRDHRDELLRREATWMDLLRSTVAELGEHQARWERFVRRERALLAWCSQAERRHLSSQERHELELSIKRQAEALMRAPIVVDQVDVHVAAAVPMLRDEARPDPADILFGVRLPDGCHEGLEAEADAVAVCWTDVLEARMHRYLQLHDADPDVDRLKGQILDALVRMASTRAKIRALRKQIRTLQARRRCRSARVTFLLSRGGRSRRAFTTGELWAADAMRSDPDCARDIDAPSFAHDGGDGPFGGH